MLIKIINDFIKYMKIKNLTLYILLSFIFCNSLFAAKWHDFEITKAKNLYTLEAPYLKITSTMKRAETKKIARKLNAFMKNINFIYPKNISEITTQLKCNLFEEKKEYFQYIKQQNKHSVKYAGGYFSSRDGEMVVYKSRDREKTLKVLIHETAHFFTHQSFQHIPQAINEGLSTYFEASAPSSSKIVIGEINNYYHAIFSDLAQKKQLTPLKALLSTQGYSHNSLQKGFTVNQYAQSWALVWYCISGPDSEIRDNFKKYLEIVTKKSDPDGKIFLNIMVQNLEQFKSQWISTMLKRNLKPVITVSKNLNN